MPPDRATPCDRSPAAASAAATTAPQAHDARSPAELRPATPPAAEKPETAGPESAGLPKSPTTRRTSGPRTDPLAAPRRTDLDSPRLWNGPVKCAQSRAMRRSVTCPVHQVAVGVQAATRARLEVATQSLKFPSPENGRITEKGGVARPCAWLGRCRRVAKEGEPSGGRVCLGPYRQSEGSCRGAAQGLVRRVPVPAVSVLAPPACPPGPAVRAGRIDRCSVAGYIPPSVAGRPIFTAPLDADNRRQEGGAMVLGPPNRRGIK